MKSILLFLILLTSCSEWFSKNPGTIHDHSPPAGPIHTGNGDGLEWGVVRCEQSNQLAIFNQELQRFLSTTNLSNPLPQVGCAQAHNNLGTRVLIKGKVKFKDGATFNSEASQVLYVADDSYLHIHVGQLQSRNNDIIRIKMQAIPEMGSVDGRYVLLAFEDNKGRVILKGEAVDEGTLIGNFSYENYVHKQSNMEPERGNLGTFAFHSPCDILDCGG